MGTAASSSRKGSVVPVAQGEVGSSPRVSSAPVKQIRRSSSDAVSQQRRPQSGGAKKQSRHVEEIKALRATLNQPESPSSNSTQLQDANLKEAVTRLTQQLREEINARHKAEDRAKQMERQLLLKDGMMRQEKIAVLRAKLTELNSDEHPGTFGNTIDAQLKNIKRLESEIADLRKENAAIQEKYGRKVKKVRSQSAKKRAEASIEILTLKEEVNNLKRENTKLNHRLERSASSDTKKESTVEHTDSSSSTALVLSLSAQIEELDEELRIANETIDSLQAQLQTHSTDS